MDTLIILNPTAGAGRAARLWARHGDAARRALDADVVETEAPGHARELARDAVAKGCRQLVAVGGDGTLHEVVNGALPSDVRIAVVPVGTGNDFARCAGVPRDPQRALFGLAEGSTRLVDLGRVLGQYYLHVAGAGFDAEVAARVNAGPRKAHGAVPYVLTALGVLAGYENRRYRLQYDDATDERTCVLVAVGNAFAYAGGMRICPRARMDDGLLDVCLVGDLGRLALLAMLGIVFTGAHLRHPRVGYRQTRTLRLDGPADVTVHADGEPAGTLPADFEIAPRALNLWAPRPSAAAAGNQ